MADPPPHTTPTTGQTRDPERRRPLGGMDRMRRILVHVCRDQMAPQRAQFVQSLTGHFSEGGADEVQVSCSLEKNQFVLRRGGPGGALPLKRPPFCPIKHLSVAEAAALPLDVQQRGVDVGVAILLQTANQRVLLTRRAKELRIFPNVWVPPGGHLESDETLLDAGLRELKEETGLSLEPEEVSPLILGLWESVYPPMLSRGPPQRHHVVVYMLLQSCRSHLELQASLSPSPAEVSACLWADARLVGAIVAAVDGEDGAVDGEDGAVDGEDGAVDGQDGAVDGEDGAVPLDHLPSSISVSQVSAGGALTDVSLPLTVFVSRAPPRGPDVERVSTGTKFALELWLKSLETPDP